MKQVIVQAFCDLCDGDEQVAATTEVTHNGRMLDVCNQHHRAVGELMRRLDNLFAEGVPVEAPPPSRPRKGVGGRVKAGLVQSVEWRTCPECGYECPTRSALGQHAKSKHGKRLADYEWPESI